MCSSRCRTGTCRRLRGSPQLGGDHAVLRAGGTRRMQESLQSATRSCCTRRARALTASRERAQPVELRHLAQPEPRWRRSSPRDAGRGLSTSPSRARPLAGQVREPLKIAEEYALLDCITGGRLIAGFPVGLSYDANQNGGIPAIETASRYREHRELIQKAWAATEPFAWNGRFENTRSGEHLAAPGRSSRSRRSGSRARGRRHAVGHPRREYVFTFLSWFGPTLIGRRIFDRYWELADEQGRDRNPYRLAFLQVVAVSDTDAERREALRRPHLETPLPQRPRNRPGAGFALPGYVEPAGIEHMIRNPGELGISRRCRHHLQGDRRHARRDRAAARRRWPTRSTSSSRSSGSATCS